VVLDASLALAWCFEDEKTDETEEVHEFVMQKTAEIAVPAIFWTEVANGLLVGERRGRSTEEWTARCLEMLWDLPIREVPMATEKVVGMARRHGLTAYDAGYLHLAVELGGSPLMTVDKRLRAAASELKLPLIPMEPLAKLKQEGEFMF
jgi:predicted nucleic acid-binding protein